jgi:hypothetical protein
MFHMRQKSLTGIIFWLRINLIEDWRRVMRPKVKEKIGKCAAQDQCCHYWIIEIANGPKSRGVCKYCGESRDFLNSIPDLTAPKRRANPLQLPEMPKVKLDEGSDS